MRDKFDVMHATSSEATRLSYQVTLANGEAGWVQAVVPVDIDRGTDGRPSSLRFDFVPEGSSPQR